VLIVAASLITLLALFYAEENIRGKHAWEQYRREAEARGEQLQWKEFIPKPVPDEENFAATPFIKSWFVRSNSAGIWKGDNYLQARDHIAVPEARRETSLRQFLDLVAWSNALAVVGAGKMTGWQKFASDKLDFKSRSKAAPSVLEGLKTNDAVFAELRAASRRRCPRAPRASRAAPPPEPISRVRPYP